MKHMLELYENENHPSRKAVYRAIIESSNNLGFTLSTLRRATEAIKADMDTERERDYLLKGVR